MAAPGYAHQRNRADHNACRNPSNALGKLGHLITKSQDTQRWLRRQAKHHLAVRPESDLVRYIGCVRSHSESGSAILNVVHTIKMVGHAYFAHLQSSL